MGRTVKVEPFSLAPEGVEALHRFLADQSADVQLDWVEFCCSGRWVRSLLQKEPWSRNPIFAQMVIASACARIFHRVLQGGEPPLLTRDTVARAVEAARVLSREMKGVEALPIPALSPLFIRGLSAVSEWRYSDSVAVTSRHLGGWRRWAAHELARALLRAFNVAPSNLLTELLALAWPGTHDSWIRGVLTQARIECLRLEVAQEKEQERQLEQALLEAIRLINRSRPRVMVEALEQADRLSAQAGRLRGGQSRFENNSQALAAALDALSQVSDVDAAESLKAALIQVAADYDLS